MVQKADQSVEAVPGCEQKAKLGVELAHAAQHGEADRLYRQIDADPDALKSVAQ